MISDIFDYYLYLFISPSDQNLFQIVDQEIVKLLSKFANDSAFFASLLKQDYDNFHELLLAFCLVSRNESLSEIKLRLIFEELYT